ncbi:helix-turn-helix domain-containing protein [Hyphomonas oceanitis]|uniref:HTH cro/C1-type domain-containing protein n=1 Tax=Hyphomonas oceanitis SCH89 TaxID=1280953 RepID=A0A059G7M9_9PROT|nr:XRE family transcriptional regulator [Hyphomonas oceanitis]KDA02595.1 hypothetical protein HOC_09119 [Hyphomonas oceanitis SCH89]
MNRNSKILPFPSAARETASGRHLIPERITEARIVEKLSQTDLSRLVGVKRQSISYFESGERNPDPETLRMIADALKQPMAYFATPSAPKFGKRTANFFRKHGPDTKRRNAASDQYAEWFSQVTFALTDFVNLPEVTLPSFEPSGEHDDPNRYTWDEIEELAGKTREHLGLGLGPISNVVRLVETHGVTVGRLILKGENVSAFSFWSGDRPFIFLASDKESSARARFDACHELAHLVLHRWVTQDEIDDKTRLKEIEKEADYFAGAFLLPRRSFPAEVLSPRLSSFLDLKLRWKVSIQAMVYRCKSLGIFDEDQCVNLYKQISAKNWRTKEPFDGPDGLPLEEPLLLRRVAELVFAENRMRRDELLCRLGFSPSIAELLLGLPNGSLADTPSDDLTIDLK